MMQARGPADVSSWLLDFPTSDPHPVRTATTKGRLADRTPGRLAAFRGETPPHRTRRKLWDAALYVGLSDTTDLVLLTTAQRLAGLAFG
jgi:hypothetical protein